MTPGEKVIPFGPYQGETFQEIWTKDPKYLEGLLKKDTLSKDKEFIENLQDFLDTVR